MTPNPEALETIKLYVTRGLAAFLAIVLHEISHGFAAYKLGDMTAKEKGRLSLNPVKHVDVLGLLMLITVGFGWAKPVPVDMRHFKKPRRDLAIVSFAGPLMNFLVAFVAMLCLTAAGLSQMLFGVPEMEIITSFFSILMSINLGLGIFNLFPVPPLDGSKILGVLLPQNLQYLILRYEQYGKLLLIALLWFKALDKPLTFLFSNVWNAYAWVGTQIINAVYQVTGGFAGG